MNDATSLSPIDPSDYGPHLPLWLFPEPDRAAAFDLTKYFWMLRMYVDRLNAAVTLYNSAATHRAQAYEARQQLYSNARCDHSPVDSSAVEQRWAETKLFGEWQAIAARDGALSIYHFGEMMHGIRDQMLPKIPTLSAAMNRQKLKEADLAPDMTSFRGRICSGYAPQWGGWQIPSV